MNKRTIIRIIVFVLSLFVIIYFHQTTGMKELVYMLLGVAGILWVLYDYNEAFKKPSNYSS